MLIRENGAETGMQMTVEGDIKPTMGPKTHFVPVMLSQANAADEGGLVTLAELMAKVSAERVPDVFPIPPDGLPTSVRVIRNFSELDIGSKWFEFRRIDATVAALNDSLAASTFLDGAGRVVAVMRGADFRSIFGQGAAGITVGSSVEPKLNAVVAFCGVSFGKPRHAKVKGVDGCEASNFTMRTSIIWPIFCLGPILLQN